MRGRVHIGTSGWNYKHWKGVFYPANLPQKKWLEHYAEHFRTVEVNNTFYQLPQASTFETWRETVRTIHNSREFKFALKASRFITHMKKLKDPKSSSEKFFDRSERLEESLGPILFQLPPGWSANVDRLAEFLMMLPIEHKYAFEFRNESWLNNDVFNLLRRHNVAFCIQDFRGKQSPREITADFTYVRMHGPGEMAYVGSYSDADLQLWGQQISRWRRELANVYVYFNNDIGGCAVNDARRLQDLAGES
jgi:uncharacterized protein YecE (DUF72 family)